MVNGVAISFQPQCETRLMDRKACLDEEVAQWKYPELPLFCDAEDFLAIPRIMAQWFLTFGNETFPLLVGFFFGDIKSLRRLREVRDEEVAKKSNRQRYDATDNEQPLRDISYRAPKD